MPHEQSCLLINVLQHSSEDASCKAPSYVLALQSLQCDLMQSMQHYGILELLETLHKCDAGVLLYVIMAGNLPFDEPNLPSLFKKIALADYPVPTWFTPDMTSLFKTMLNPNAQKRYASLEQQPQQASLNSCQLPMCQAVHGMTNTLCAPTICIVLGTSFSCLSTVLA